MPRIVPGRVGGGGRVCVRSSGVASGRAGPWGAPLLTLARRPVVPHTPPMAGPSDAPEWHTQGAKLARGSEGRRKRRRGPGCSQLPWTVGRGGTGSCRSHVSLFNRDVNAAQESRGQTPPRPCRAPCLSPGSQCGLGATPPRQPRPAPRDKVRLRPPCPAPPVGEKPVLSASKALLIGNGGAGKGPLHPRAGASLIRVARVAHTAEVTAHPMKPALRSGFQQEGLASRQAGAAGPSGPAPCHLGTRARQPRVTDTGSAMETRSSSCRRRDSSAPGQLDAC